MATMTTSLPDPMKERFAAKINQGDYAGTSDDARDLVRRGHEWRIQAELAREDLRRIVDEARTGGSSRRKVPEILAWARKHAQVDPRRMREYTLTARVEADPFAIPGWRHINIGQAEAYAGVLVPTG